MQDRDSVLVRNSYDSLILNDNQNLICRQQILYYQHYKHQLFYLHQLIFISYFILIIFYQFDCLKSIFLSFLHCHLHFRHFCQLCFINVGYLHFIFGDSHFIFVCHLHYLHFIVEDSHFIFVCHLHFIIFIVEDLHHNIDQHYFLRFGYFNFNFGDLYIVNLDHLNYFNKYFSFLGFINHLHVNYFQILIIHQSINL